MGKMENLDRSCEWLQSNHAASFAMGTIDRIPRRKYHSLLTIREPGHGEPLHVVLDVGEYIETDDSFFMLHSFNFGDRIEPKGERHLRDFAFRPYPKWTYDVDGMKVERLLQLDREHDVVRLFYKFNSVRKPTRIRLRPFVTCRPMHHLTQENPFLNGAPEGNGDAGREGSHVSFQFYERSPKISMRVSGHAARFVTRGEWVQKLFYSVENERGYPAFEDTYVPGEFELQIDRDSELVLEIGVGPLPAPAAEPDKGTSADTLISKLEWAGEQYLVSSKKKFHSIVAGYPWFGSWGRDAFISLAGLTIESGEMAQAEKILESYGEKIVEGLTRCGIVCAFPDDGLIMTGIDTPLLFIRAVQQLRERSPQDGFRKFMPIVCRILNALKHGADRRVHVSIDGGLFVEPGPWAVTWMDVLLDGQPVTPRAGFAVDVNALFFNALHFAMEWAKVHDSGFVKEWTPFLEKAEESFLRRFWSPERGYLADAHDGTVADFSLRPNQLWAVALPFSPVSRDIGAKVLEAVRKDLLTPVGLRTLSPKDPRYVARYAGGHRERDLAYHQGTIWPWLLGIYGDAVLKVHGSAQLKKEFAPILKRISQHMETEACLGQISEVFDASEPHRPDGTPAQAWSVAEILRIAKRLQL